MKRTLAVFFAIISTGIWKIDGASGSGWIDIPEGTQPYPTSIPGGSVGPLSEPDGWPACPPSNTILEQPAIAEFITDELRALARNLENDPVRIYNYVKSYIKYVHYFGAKKGAALTLSEGSGNDFDQCALLVALLRAAQESSGSNYTICYQFGAMNLPFHKGGTQADLRHWLGITLETTAPNYVKFNLLNRLNIRRGFPRYLAADANVGDGYYVLLRQNHSQNYFIFHRVWIKLSYPGGATYHLDPGFKISELIPRAFSVATAMSGSASELLSQAVDPALNTVIDPNYVRNLSWPNLNTKLNTYAGNLLNYLKSANQNYSVLDVIGGSRIRQNESSALPQLLAFEPLCGSVTLHTGSSHNFSVLEWENIPAAYLSSVQFSIPSDVVNRTFYLPEVRGRKITLTFPNTVARIGFDDGSNDVAQVTGSTSSGAEAHTTVTIRHPFGYWADGMTSIELVDRYDHAETKAYKRSANYVIAYAFDDPGKQLSRRQEILEKRLRQPGANPQSSEIVTDTLDIIGLNWFQQAYWSHCAIASQNDVLPFYHHAMGRVGQETTPQPRFFVDFGLRSSADMWHAGDPYVPENKRPHVTRLKHFVHSALEHSVIEQLQGVPSASALKAIFLGNSSGQKLILGTFANKNTVNSLLQGETVRPYSAGERSSILAEITNNVTMLLPSGKAQVGNSATPWIGYGFVKETPTGTQTTIQGPYNGGEAGDPAVVDPPEVAENSESAPKEASPTQPPVNGADPVNMRDGSFTLNSTDLSIGQEEPRGLSFARHYDSGRRFRDDAFMAGGWTHNYNMRLADRSDAGAALGQRTPAEMAAFLVAITAAYDVLTGTPDATNPKSKRWAVAALIAEWAVDQIRGNALVVNLGSESLQFIRQIDGVFTAPAGITMTMDQVGGLYTLQERHGRTFVFDAPNKRIKEIQDPFGKKMTFVYDGSGRLQTATDGWGASARTLTFAYTGSPQRLTAVTDSTGRAVSFGYGTTYHAEGDLLTFTDAEGKAWSFEYDNDHKILKTKEPNPGGRYITQNFYDVEGKVFEQNSEADPAKKWKIYVTDRESVEKNPAGGRTTYYWDEKKRLVRAKDANGNSAHKVYDGEDHVIESITPKGESTKYEYDGNNNLRKVTDPLLKFATFGYDSALRLQTKTDFRGKATTYTYNAQHQVLTVTKPNVNDNPNLPSVVQFAYNADGTLQSQIDEDGKAISFLYDSRGQMSQRTHPIAAHVETFVNNARGDVTSRTDANGVTTTFAYNNRRELTSRTVLRAAGNIVTELQYDNAGNLWKTIDPKGNATVHAYSPTRKLLTQTLPQLPSGTAPVIANHYDSRDWLQTRSIPLTTSYAAPTSYQYDAGGRVLSVTDPLNRAEQYGYNENGQRTSVKSPLATQNQTTSYAYNARGEQNALTDAVGLPIQYTYDENGNALTIKNRNNGTFASAYYGDNRLSSSATPTGKTTARTYNKRGLPALVTEPSGQQTSYSYDDRGRLTGKTDPAGISTYIYDKNNNLLNHAENSRTITRVYDELNRLTSYADEDGNVIGYQYDNNSNLTRLTYPGGTKHVNYTYDSHNRLTSATDWAGRITSFEYDLAGHVIRIARPNGTVRNITYDNAGQTTQINELASNGLPLAYYKLDYDEAGRVTKEFIAPIPASYTEPIQTITHDADNRIATFNGGAVVHDNDGNMTSGPLNSNSAVTHTYDARNRLMDVAASGTAPALSYSYDSEGNRIAVTQTGQTTRYVINPGAALSQALVRTKPDGSKTYYVYGLGLLYQVDDAGNTATYHYDLRGSTVAITSNSGQVTDRVEYSPYGAITRRTGSTDTPFLYNGRYGVMTDANGLYHMRARYYNPFIKRFINADPSGFSGGMNWYAYADGNPISLIDPFGLGAAEPNGRSWFRRVGQVAKGLVLVVAGFIPYVGDALDVQTVASPKSSSADRFISGASLSINAATGGLAPNAGPIKRGVQAITDAFRGDESVSMGFQSFDALKRVIGSPGENNAWHHIVEQSQVGRFGAEAIHNIDNIIAIPGELNANLNRVYSSIRPDITGSSTLTVREWLSTKSLQQN